MGLPALFRAVFVIGAAFGLQLKALFADAGVGISCPSGNKVYVHPISGDLQQCSQQLGFYNQTSCPGGTVCERFPILIPGFQDYCCWADDTNDEEKEANGVLPPPEDLSGSIFGTSPPPEEPKESEEDEDDEWIPMPTTPTPLTKKTKRPPRSRRIRPTTTEAPTTTTTTARPVQPRRGPKCRNPDDAPLIDFGNRLRDCYFQQCPYGYRCEFNAEIRRYVCCGAERDVFPPPGLPPLPAPKPLVPRPFRPQHPPYYHEDESLECPSGAEFRPSPAQIAVCSPEDPQLKCPASHPDCVHSSFAGQMVCCRLVRRTVARFYLDLSRMALLRGLLLAALLVAVRARETLLYDSEHKTPVKLRFVGGPETQSSVRPRSGKSGEQLAALRLLPKDLSNVRLSEPKSRKFMIHEALANSSAQGRLALVPADNSVISSDVDLHKILQRTTMKMRPYPTTTPETPTEVPSEHSENEIIEEPLNLSPAAAVQQQPPEPPKQLPPARPSLPRASQLPAAVPMASALTPPPPSFAAEATPSGDKEPLGCGWDILSNSCKDLFGLGWCLECRDFGNIFFHDCKCAMRAPSVPSVAPQNPQPTPFPLVAPQPQMAVPQLPQVPQIPQIPQVPQVPQFPQIPQTPSVGVLPPAPQQLFILRT